MVRLNETSSSSRSGIPLGLLFLPFLILSGCGDGVPDFTPEDLARATTQVRDAYHLLDYEHGAELGERWVGWAPGALELKAWTVANFAMAGAAGTAAKMAEEMITAHPDSAWSAFAQAGAWTWTTDRDHGDEAVEAAERAMEGLPNLIQAVLLRGQAIATFQDLDSALAFAATQPEEWLSHPDVRVALLKARERAAGSLDDATADQLLHQYRDVLRDRPDHIAAIVEAALLLRDFKDDFQESLSYLERAAALTPSPAVHRDLWRGIFADPSLDEATKVDRVRLDLGNVVENAGESPARWAALAGALKGLGLEEVQAELEDRVLVADAGGWGSEMVLADRVRALDFEFANELNGDPHADPVKTADFRRSLEDFIDLEEHRDPRALFTANWNLFLLEKDNPGVDPARLTELAREWAEGIEAASVRYMEDYYGFGALALARHPGCTGEARRLVDLAWEKVEGMEAEAQEIADGEEEDGGASGSGGDQPDFFQEGLAVTRAFINTAMGRILAQEGSLDEAEAELARARQLDPANTMAAIVLPLAFHESGSLLEKRADLARAEGAEADAEAFLRSADQLYQEGVRLEYSPYMGTPQNNPNEEALESLYERMHGTLEGFETHLAALKDAGWEERRETILAERISDPQPLEPFDLETLDGEEVTSESLLGSVAIINFWGTW